MTASFLAWLAAGAVSSVGTGVIGFVITWTATGINGSLAGTLSALELAPTVALLLIGGSIGDRYGQRRVLLVTTLIEIVQYLAFWALLGTRLDLMTILLVNAAVIGVVAGIGSPSTTVIARQFVASEHVRAAISLSTLVNSIVRMINPSLGAAALALFGLRGSLLVQAGSFVGVIAVLVLARPVNEPPRQRAQPLHRDVLTGMRSVWSDRHARALLTAIAFVAGSMLPMTGLGFPLLARANHWGPGAVALIAGAWTAGSIATSATIAARYTRNPHAAAAGVTTGPVLAGATTVVLAVQPNLCIDTVACALMGVGTALFTSNVGPILIALAPPEQQSRWASATILAQFIPVLLVNPVLGVATDQLGVTPTILAIAVMAFTGAAAARAAHRHAQPPASSTRP